MNRLKLKIASILAITSGLTLAFSAKATSTVLLDPPDVSELVGYAYDIAQPLLNSIWPWVGVIVGIGVVFFAIRIITNFFGGH